MKNILVIVLFFLSTIAYSAHKSYSISQRFALEGSEGWDCLSIDTLTDRLFITRSNHVDVFDLKSEKVIGKISEQIDGAHGVAFVNKLNKGYITSGNNSKVIVFDLVSLKMLREINVGKKPDIIIFDQFSSRIFSFNAIDNTVSIIDPNTDLVIKTLKLESNPEFAVSDDLGSIYVNLEEKGMISSIDTKEMIVKKTWPIVGCSEPTGIAIDTKLKTIFSACSNEVLAITDIKTNKVIKTLKIGKRPDGAAFDNGIVFSSNGSGSLSIIAKGKDGSYENIQELETQIGARTLTVDPITHRIYLLAAKYEPIDPKMPQARPKIIQGSVELLVVKNQ